MGQRARHGGNAVTARRIGAHEALEADDEVRELGRRVEGPTPGTRGASIHVYLGEAIRKLEPALRRATGVVDDGAARGIMVRLGRPDGLHDTVDDEVDIKVLARRDGVVVCLEEGGQAPAEREGAAWAQIQSVS